MWNEWNSLNIFEFVCELQLVYAQLWAPFPCQEGVFAVLVCRVTMGKMNVTSSDTEAGEKVKRKEYDSTCGKRVLSAVWISEWMSQNDEMCSCDITSGTRYCNWLWWNGICIANYWNIYQFDILHILLLIIIIIIIASGSPQWCCGKCFPLPCRPVQTFPSGSLFGVVLCPGLFRELVIYYSDQCYPEYLVLYQRVHAKVCLASLCKCGAFFTLYQWYPVIWTSQRLSKAARMLKMRLAMSWSESFLCRCPCTGGLKHQRSSKDKDKACPGLVRPFTTIEVDMCCDQSSFEQFLFIQVCRSEIIHYLYRTTLTFSCKLWLWHTMTIYYMTIMIILCIATSPWILSMAQRNVATDLTKKHFRDHHELAGRGQDCLSRYRMIEILVVTATRAD